jgi:hypothetical protein
LTARYRTVARRIIDAALADDDAWKKLAYLSDRIGARQSGSAGMALAITWAKGALEADRHQAARTEEVMVPVWVRGKEEATLLSPAQRPLAVLGLGGTVQTPRGGLEAEVVVAPTFEALEALGEKVKGKMVLYSHRLEPVAPPATPGYGTAVAFRGLGPSRAARLGAVAALVRSLATHSLRSPHTGALHYEPGVPQIPAAALATEDADLIVRLAAAGERVKVRLDLASSVLPEAKEANVVAELRGREHPEEIVLIGAHLDSWDVGQGAQDDGAGVATTMGALTLLRRLSLYPRRTIRLVLFTHEESGGRGAKAYAERHRDELPRHLAALEMDSGAGRPLGLGVQPNHPGLATLQEIVALLEPVGATRARADGHPGADVDGLAKAGVPLVAYDTDMSQYFDIHHSQADTLDKVDPALLRQNVAAMAVTAYVLADMPGQLAR